MTINDTVKARLAEIESAMNEIQTASESEGRLLTADEKTKLVALTTEYSELRQDLELREKIAAVKVTNAQPVRHTAPARPAMSILSNEKPFRNLGEMALAVRAKAIGNANERMVNALSVYSSEGTDADGGVAVPGEFKTNIEKEMLGQSSLLPLCTQIPLTQNSVVFPVDDGTPWAPFSGTGHLAKKAEAVALDQVKPGLSTLTLTAHKVGCIVPVTEELQQDNAAFAAYIQSVVGEALTYKVNDLILKGSGTGEAKGYLSSSAVKTVASGSGQAADTVIAKNVADMFFAMPQSSRANAVWVVNPNVEAQLYGLVISGTTNAAYVPGGSMAGAPHSTLLGRPVIVLPNAPALGDLGDVSFVDLSKYWVVTKGGLKAESSIHFYFDQVVNAFRFYVRIGGDTRRQAVITLPDASTQSYYVKLAAR